MVDALYALSPLDGRYAGMTAPLSEYFSEFAFLRDRVRVELDYLAALSTTGLIRSLSGAEAEAFDALKVDFSTPDAERIQAYERETRHDVKAIEYYLREKLKETSLTDVISWIHFGLTSEDVNNIALAIALRNSRDHVLLPALDNLLADVREFAVRNRAMPRLGRTHGQIAVPT